MLGNVTFCAKNNKKKLGAFAPKVRERNFLEGSNEG